MRSGLGADNPLSLWLYGRGRLSITFLLGVLLFVFDLFSPIKALYSQATRLPDGDERCDKEYDVVSKTKVLTIIEVTILYG